MLDAEAEALARAAAGGEDVAEVRARIRERAASNRAYLDACGRAFHPVRTAGDLRFVPERLVASRGTVHALRDPRWHGDALAPACRAAPHVLRGTTQAVIDLAAPAAEADAMAWWKAILARGGAGLVVCPLEMVDAGRPLPPAIRCRGADALRLAHGPGPLRTVTRPGAEAAADRAAREWALSLEALERFTAGEPVGRVHPCVFAALALKLGVRR